MCGQQNQREIAGINDLLKWLSTGLFVAAALFAAVAVADTTTNTVQSTHLHYGRIVILSTNSVTNTVNQPKGTTP